MGPRVWAACALAASILPGPACGFVVPSIETAPSGRLSSINRRAEDRRSRSSLMAERVATFGMGCFWAPAESMLKTPGVIYTVSGYTGNPGYVGRPPKYDDVCFGRQWVEGVRVTYDDAVVSYAELLDSFFDAQEPQYGSRQYGSMIFPSDEEQMRVATMWLEQGTAQGRTRERDGLPVGMTTIEPASTFYAAEGYHQKYWEKWRVRFGVGAVMLAVASGALGPLLPANDPDLAQRVETIANGVFVAGGIFALAERQFDAKVVEMQ